MASASQASVATTAAGSTATSGNNSPRGTTRATLPASRQGAVNSTTARPRSAGRVGQLSRTNTATSNAPAPGGAGASASSSSRAETSRTSPRRQVSRPSSNLGAGMHSGNSSSSRATGKVMAGNASGVSRHPNGTFGSRVGVGDDARFTRPNSSARSSFGGNGDVLSSRAKSPGSRSETPQDERAAARQRACSPSGRTGTPTGRRRSPGPTSGRIPDSRSPSPPPLAQLSNAEWNGYPEEHTGIATALPSTSSTANAQPGGSLVDVLGRIAVALERSGEEGGATSGATAAAVVAAAASAVAEANRPFAMPRAGVPPVSGEVRSLAPGDTAPGRGGTSPPLREREGDRSTMQQEVGKIGMAPSSGSSSNANAMLQMMSELEARLHRTEQSLATVVANQSSTQVEAVESRTADEQMMTYMHALESRAARLEHEVADLRAQVGRRLDSAARDAAASRREAEEARTEAATLRSEVADLMAQLLQAPSFGNLGAALRSGGSNATDHEPARSDETSTSSLNQSSSGLLQSQSSSGILPARPLKQDTSGDAEVEPSAITSPNQTLARSGSSSLGDEQSQVSSVVQHAVKFVPAPLAASDTTAATVFSASVVGPQRGMPSRMPPARATFPQGASPNSATVIGSGSAVLRH